MSAGSSDSIRSRGTGRDKDGDQIGNGVYLYKVIIKQGEKQIESISKLVKMR
jgi:hypothetical protein